MKDELVGIEVARLAKEKGFNIPQVKGYYTHGDTQLVLWVDSEDYNNQKDFLGYAPTQSLLQRWLREVHNIHIEASLSWGLKYFFKVYQGIADKYTTEDSLSYEEGLETALQEALKLIK